MRFQEVVNKDKPLFLNNISEYNNFLRQDNLTQDYFESLYTLQNGLTFIDETGITDENPSDVKKRIDSRLKGIKIEKDKINVYLKKINELSDKLNKSYRYINNIVKANENIQTKYFKDYSHAERAIILYLIQDNNKKESYDIYLTTDSCFQCQRMLQKVALIFGIKFTVYSKVGFAGDFYSDNQGKLENAETRPLEKVNSIMISSYPKTTSIPPFSFEESSGVFYIPNTVTTAAEQPDAGHTSNADTPAYDPNDFFE
jgi:deoxycytidylate deaminase